MRRGKQTSTDQDTGIAIPRTLTLRSRAHATAVSVEVRGAVCTAPRTYLIYIPSTQVRASPAKEGKIIACCIEYTKLMHFKVFLVSLVMQVIGFGY